jgi:hypothetical protein
MTAKIVIPSFTTLFIDQRTGVNSREWFRYFEMLLGGGIIVATGHATLVAGTVTVPNAFADSANEFQLTAKVVGGTQGILSVGTVVLNTSFVINSSNAADTSTVSWAIIQPIVRN